MTDLEQGNAAIQPPRAAHHGIAGPVAADCVVTFAVTGGIFGVGRLATRLNKLLESGKIGVWHIGPWVDWQHTAICIKFDCVADSKLSEESVRLDLEDAQS